MRRIAVINEKGGSGKTATAVSLAACLAERGRRVLLVDLDYQGGATKWCACEEAGAGSALFDALTDEGHDLEVRSSKIPGVDLIGSSPKLAGIDRAMAHVVGAEGNLRDALDRLPRDRWDVVLMDCPPARGMMSVSALIACGEVLAPVEASYLGLEGLATLCGTIAMVQKRLNRRLTLGTVLACRVDGTNDAKDNVTLLRERFPDVTLDTVIRQNVRLREAVAAGIPITTYDPRSLGAQDYRDAAAELLARWKRAKRAKGTPMPARSAA